MQARLTAENKSQFGLQFNNKKIARAAVLGDPISHSLSPIIHNHFLQKYRINGEYLAIKLLKGEFESGVKKLVNEGFTGFNVTIPHKETAYKICHELSETAQIIGAVNTIAVSGQISGQIPGQIPGQKIFGDNSDAYGFISNLRTQSPEFDFRNKRAVIIGAGGASRAVIYGLASEGVSEIILTNRSEERAKNLALNFSSYLKKTDCVLEIVHLEKVCSRLNHCDLLVNCTSLGMKGQPELNFNLENLKKSALVYDLVYNPLRTKLLLNAKKHGNSTIDGLGMLIDQAKVGFNSWFGIWPEGDSQLVSRLISHLNPNF